MSCWRQPSAICCETLPECLWRNRFAENASGAGPGDRRSIRVRYYLQTHGLNVVNDIDIRYVGSQESSVMNVFHGDTAAGATWPPPWRALSKERPELRQQLKVIWKTEPLPNNGLVVRDNVPDEITNQVTELMVNLHKHNDGRKILERMELSQFEIASDQTYQPVIDFIRIFEESVRPIK